MATPKAFHEKAENVTVLIGIELEGDKFQKLITVKELLMENNIALAENFKKIIGEEIRFAIEDEVDTWDEELKNPIYRDLDQELFKIYERNIKLTDNDLMCVLRKCVKFDKEYEISVKLKSSQNSNRNRTKEMKPEAEEKKKEGMFSHIDIESIKMPKQDGTQHFTPPFATNQARPEMRVSQQSQDFKSFLKSASSLQLKCRGDLLSWYRDLATHGDLYGIYIPPSNTLVKGNLWDQNGSHQLSDRGMWTERE